jgi:hypothetical protein
MKLLIACWAFLSVLSSCGSAQDKAVKKAEEIQSAVKASAGGIASSDGGWTMTAKINGKAWKATSFYSPDRAGVILGQNDKESISLPYYDRHNFLANDKKKLGDGHSLAEMRLNDDVVVWTATKGEVELTKVDDHWAEGTFYFTAKGFQTDKTLEVTDGFFRISIAQAK